MFGWLSSVLVRWMLGIIVALLIALAVASWQLKRSWQDLASTAANCRADQLQGVVDQQGVVLRELEAAKQENERRAEILEGIIKQISVKSYEDKTAILAERDFWIRKARRVANSDTDCGVLARLSIECLYDEGSESPSRAEGGS